MLDLVLPVYVTGLGYSIIGGLIIAFGFAIIRWHLCVQEYIKTGNLESADDSWFLGENNWFHGSRDRDRYDYGNAPIVVAVDIITIFVLTAILSLAWPITIIAFTVITYAMVARVRFARKKEFMERLKGEHDELANA
jgi:hypothetical protein